MTYITLSKTEYLQQLEQREVYAIPSQSTIDDLGEKGLAGLVRHLNASAQFESYDVLYVPNYTDEGDCIYALAKGITELSA